MKPSFSVSLIARNEAKSLPRLMKSLEEFSSRGGEVTLVDTGSDDGTPQVARDLGIHVYEAGERFLFEVPADLAEKINKHFLVNNEDRVIEPGDKLFDYAAARNHSAYMCSSDYISTVDCDEWFSKLDLDAIERTLAEGWDQIEHHFIFSRYPNGKPAVQFTCARFYDRRKMRWKGIIHEILTGEGRHTYLGPDVIELEHTQDWQQGPRRRRYLAALAMDCYLHASGPGSDRQSHYLGRELVWTGRLRSGIKELERHIAMNNWAQERGQSMIFIGDAHMALGAESAALDAYHRAILIDGSRREAWLRLAQHFWKKNDPQKTASYCAAALEIPLNDCYCNHGRDYADGPHEMLYWAEYHLGNHALAKEHYDKALAFDPKNSKYQNDRVWFYPEEFEYRGPNIEGWMSNVELEWLYQQAKKANAVLELGAWKGRSTHALLSGCKGTVTVVDHWQGSRDPGDETNWLAKQADIHSEFMKNVGDFPNLRKVRASSAEAVRICEGCHYDLVFIDGPHTYEEVKQNIYEWLPKSSGIIAGHDYDRVGLPSIKQAVDEVLGEPENVCDTIWWFDTEKFKVPKSIFTIWLGDVPSTVAMRCIGTQAIEGYKHRVLGLDDCEREGLMEVPYFRDAVAGKKWVKASDFLRVWWLYKYGGIYLDADVEVLPGKNFDDLLNCSLFASAEKNRFISLAIVGARPKHPVLKAHLEEVQAKFKGTDDAVFGAGIELFTPRMYMATGDPTVKVLPPEYFIPYNQQKGEIEVTENTRTFHHFMQSWTDAEQPLPCVSVLLPQLGREEGLKRCLESIDRLYWPKHRIETLIDDGPDTVPMKVNRLYRQAAGDVMVFAANDVEFTPESLYRAVKASDGKGLVAFNAGQAPDGEKSCEHFIIWRQTVEMLGEIFSEKFNHVGCDNLLWAKCEKLGLARRCEEAVVHHHHFSRGEPMDEIYEKGWSNCEEDRRVLQEELAKLNGEPLWQTC